MANILIAYSTTDGHTLKICLRLKAQLTESMGHTVTLLSLSECITPDLSTFDQIIIGASIRYGKHKQCVYDFIERNQAQLDSKACAFFSVNVVARKPDKSEPGNNPYVSKFLRQITWHPKLVAVFAGKIDYKRYRYWDRQMIRLIMWLTDGPTDPGTEIEFTDWHKVDEFGRVIGDMPQ